MDYRKQCGYTLEQLGLPLVDTDIRFKGKAVGIIAIGFAAKGIVSVGLVSVGVFAAFGMGLSLFHIALP